MNQFPKAEQKHESERKLSTEEIIEMKQALKDVHLFVGVCDHLTRSIGLRNQEASGETPTPEWNVRMVAIIGEGLEYAIELPGDKWIDGFDGPKVFSDALSTVRAQNAAGESQNG